MVGWRHAMSFDATRAVWAARDAGAIEGASTLLVALAMADRADKGTGELVAGVRGLSARLGLGRSTANDAVHALTAAGVVEPVALGRGTRPTRWRFLLAAPPLTTPLSPHVDNDTLRPDAVTLASVRRPEFDTLRPASVPLASGGRNETSTTRITNGDTRVTSRPVCGCGLGRNHRGPCAQTMTSPAEVPGRVATVREALGATRGGGSGLAQNGTGPPPPYPPDDDGRPFGPEAAP